MNERRRDPFTRRWVILAPGRRGLGGAKPGGLPAPGGRCPFCPGHEAETEVTVARWPTEGRWRVRVVRNKYPVVTGSEGIHEVGIDAPEHDVDLPDLSAAQLTALFTVYRDRVRALEATAGVAAVVLFRNRGRRAGSSQPHPHTQIAALGWVPSDVRARWTNARRHLEEHGEPLHAAELRRERAGPRVLHDDAHLVSFCPFAPTRPFEVRFAPRAPAGGFGRAGDAVLEALGRHLRDAARRLRAATAITDYNLVLRQPPIDAAGPALAWHLELLPRTGGDAGFELGTGDTIVVVPPEEAAERLRDATPD